jgi:hypothetical protein
MIKNITQIYNTGYTNTDIEFNNKLNINELNTVANGSIENIYCDIFDSLEFSKRIILQNELMKKIRLGGSIHIRYINILLFAKRVVSGDLNINEINDIVSAIKSVIDQESFDSWIMQQSNYTIEKIDTDKLYNHIVLKE